MAEESMSKYPKTIAAAGRESKGLKDLAAALWEEIPPRGRGGAEGREAEVGPALEAAQLELSAAGYEYALSRLETMRQVAGWVAGGKHVTSQDCCNVCGERRANYRASLPKPRPLLTRLRVALIRSRVTRGIRRRLDIYGRHPRRIP